MVRQQTAGSSPEEDAILDAASNLIARLERHLSLKALRTGVRLTD